MGRCGRVKVEGIFPVLRICATFLGTVALAGRPLMNKEMLRFEAIVAE